MTDNEIWEKRWRGYGFLEMVADMQSIFSPKRAVEMFGLFVLFGAVGGETHDATVKRLLALGFKRTTVYDASRDIRQFQAFLREKWRRELNIEREVTWEDLAKKSVKAQYEYSNSVLS